MKAIIIALLSPTLLLAQTKISGRVVDDKGEPIPGANIVIEQSYDGASSAFDGTFSFTTTEAGTHQLVATFVGYKPYTQTVGLTGKPIEVTLTLTEEISELDAVVITAGSFTAGEEKRRTVLKALDIATTAGATADIAGALNTLPGTQKVGESGRLFVRGGDGSETRTFIDGMVVLDAYGPAAPNTPSRGRFLPFMFKGTSFSTGGYSAEYGQALSSALVLSSKDKAELTQTDIGLLSVGADVAHTQVWEKSSWSGKIQYTDIRPYTNLISQAVDWITPPVSLEGSTAYRHQVGQDGIIKFFGNFNRSRYQLYNRDTAQPEQKQLLDFTNRYGYGNGSYAQPLNSRWFIRGGASYNFNENDVELNGAPLNEKEEGFHGKVVLENSVSDRVEIRFGTEAITRSYTAAAADESAGVQMQAFQETVSSAFAETEAYASKKLVGKVGLRAEHNSLNETLSVDPRFSIAYQPGKRGQFSFAYGRFRQSPVNTYLRNNTSLRAEQAEHFILNYQIITNQRTFRAELYQKSYSNLIKYQQGDLQQSSNVGDGYARGVEFFWRDNQSLKNIDYWISYSFLDTKRNYLDYPHEAIPTFASRHNFSIVYKHFITQVKTQLGLTYSFSSGRPYFNPNSNNFHSDRTPAYHDLSANLSYLPVNWLIIHASMTNLLGRENIFGYQYASEPSANGEFARRAIGQPARHFIFLGVFITISKNKSVNQLPNL